MQFLDKKKNNNNKWLERKKKPLVLEIKNVLLEKLNKKERWKFQNQKCTIEFNKTSVYIHSNN